MAHTVFLLPALLQTLLCPGLRLHCLFFLYSQALIQFYNFKYFLCVNIYPRSLSCTSDTGIQWLAQLLHLEVICISLWLSLGLPYPIDDNSVQCFKRKLKSSLTPFFLSDTTFISSGGLYSNYIQNLINFHYDWVQDTLSENMTHWHMEYFKLKEFEKQQKQEGHSDSPLPSFPQKQVLKLSCQRIPPEERNILNRGETRTWRRISRNRPCSVFSTFHTQLILFALSYLSMTF